MFRVKWLSILQMPWHLREFSDPYDLESENQQIKYLRGNKQVLS